jgi:hypothetical protein
MFPFEIEVEQYDRRPELAMRQQVRPVDTAATMLMSGCIPDPR